MLHIAFIKLGQQNVSLASMKSHSFIMTLLVKLSSQVLYNIWYLSSLVCSVFKQKNVWASITQGKIE